MSSRLRRVVLLSGMLLAVAGFAMILSLPVHLAARIAGCAAWAILCWREQARFRHAYRRVLRLRMSCDGDLKVLDRNGKWLTARLLSGSVLLRRLGWMRIRTEDGHVFAELVGGRCRHDADWRRLQVIWRHVGALP